MKPLPTKDVEIFREMITEAMWEESTILNVCETSGSHRRSEALGAESALAWALITLDNFNDE